MYTISIVTMDYLLPRVSLFFMCVSMVFTNKTSRGNLGLHDTRHMLVSHLTERYDRHILPVINMSHAVDVRFDMVLQDIIRLVEKEQYLVTNMWVGLYWKDEFLTWDPADYDGIDTVHMSADTIWKPDVVLYNSVDEHKTAFEVFPAGNARISYQGAVQWFTPVVLYSMCKIKVDAYPFDQQKCPLKFGSWSYDGIKLNLSSNSDKIHGDDYSAPSFEWELMDTECQTNLLYYDCCPEPYPDVTCHVTLRRRPAFYLFTFLMPTVLLIILGLLVFYLPPESGEKVTLAITTFLSLSVYERIVMSRVPPNAEVIPLLELLMGVMGVCMLVISTAMAVFVVNVHHHGSYSRPPYLIRRLCMSGILSTICCLSKEIEDIRRKYEIMVTNSSNTNMNNTVRNNSWVSQGTNSTLEATDGQTTDCTVASVEKSKIKTFYTGQQKIIDDTPQKTLESLQQQRHHMQKRYLEKTLRSLGKAEWRLVAMTMDRVFFMILLLTSLIMSFVIFKDVL